MVYQNGLEGSHGCVPLETPFKGNSQPPPPNMPIRLLRYFIKMASRNCKVTIPQHGYWQPKQIEAQKTKY